MIPLAFDSRHYDARESAPAIRQASHVWSGSGPRQGQDHAPCDVARLPVREVVSASHFVTGLTLGLGKVAFDYRAKA